MNLLLDSHCLLWALGMPEKLSAAALEAITTGDNQVFFSSASVWELALKSSQGKLRLSPRLVAEAHAARFTELPVRSEHAIEAADLPLLHKDAFDRMLIAQARVQKLTLVSRDTWMRKYDAKILEA